MLFYNIMSIYFFIMVFGIIYWTVNIRSLNGSGYSRVIILLGLAIHFYIFGYAMELNSDTVGQIIFWNKFEYCGIPFVSALWLLAGLMYTGHFSRYRLPLLAGIFLVPLVSMILRFTNDGHFLYFASVSFTYSYGRLVFAKTYGIWMMIQSVHSMLMIFITLGLFIRDSVKSIENKAGKVSLIITASIVAVAGLLLSYLKPFGYIIDYMAVCLPLACLLVILAILRYDFLEAKSLARSKAFESSRDAIILINRQNKVIDYNKSAKFLFANLNLDLSEGYMDALFADAPDLLESLQNKETFVLKLPVNSTQRYYEISTSSIDHYGLSHGWIKTMHDVTESHEMNRTLKKQAMMDELSGLNNRRAFFQFGKSMMEEAEQAGKTVHLLMMDLDLFKKINDQYGHQIGDEIIRYMGAVLKASFGTNSVIARLGGEEFGVLLSGFRDEEVERETNALLKNISCYEHSYRGQSFHVTISIGVAKKGCPGQSLEDLLHRADKALYQSKDQGRNRCTLF